MNWFGCDCAAQDCPSCGPAQGHEVRRVRKPGGGWTWVNVERYEGRDDDSDEQPDIEPEDEHYEA